MDIYDQTTREAIAAAIAFASTGALAIVGIKLRERAKERRKRLRRHY